MPLPIRYEVTEESRATILTKRATSKG
jgi:hypothetical protein